jgi:signal transduction histidine kinase/PAS domain-containing protein
MPAPGVAETIRARLGDLVRRWEARQRARAGPGRALPRPVLVDHLPELLVGVAAALRGGPSPRWEAAHHAAERAVEGYRVEDLVRELADLREVVLEVADEGAPPSVAEARAVASAFDAVTAAAVATAGRALAEQGRDREEARVRLEALFQSAPVGLAFWDRQLRYVRLNRWLAEADGLPVEAHLGHRPSELLPGLDGVQNLEARWREMLESGAPWSGAELSGETPAAPGVRRHWRAEFFPVGRGGAVEGIGGVVVETTGERRAVERLRFLAHATQELAESVGAEDAPDRIARLAVPALADACAVMVLADDGLPTRAGAHAADPAVAREVVAILDEARREDALAPFGDALWSGAVHLVPRVRAGHLAAAARGPELRARLRRLGVRSWLAVPLAVHGKVVGALALATLRTRRELSPEDLELAQELARRSAVALENARLLHEARAEAALRERVLALVSHDLRNPLSTVLLGASRLRAAELPGPAGERVTAVAEQIQRSVARMRRLIDDLLDAVALESGQLSIHLAAARPVALLTEAAEGLAGALGERGLRVAVQAAAELPLVRADHDRVLQVLGNLLSNAVKVSPDGGRIVLSAARRGGEVVFGVADEGPGIPAEERIHLFEPFRRGARAGYKGTGLGLAIARGLVDAHGGRIWFEDADGVGAKVAFTLPVADEGAGAAATH